MRFYFIILMLVLMPFQANADATRHAMKLIDRTTAQGACASYIGYMGSNYRIGGFVSEQEANRIQEEHWRLASEAAEELVALGISQKIDGQMMISPKGSSICLADLCFAKVEYIEALFLMSGAMEAEKAVARKEINCPEGVWSPCFGGVPVDNWEYKAATLYDSKNCSLLIP